MTHTDYEDDYPEGIAADAFDPRPEPMTGGEKAILMLAGGLFAMMFSYCLFCAFEFARDLVQP
jgi:hypothetical protein